MKVHTPPSTQSRQYDVVIKGTIYDYEYPLPGVNIVLKGSKITAQTDFDGNFNLTIPQGSLKLNATLAVSHIGYRTKEVNINKVSRSVDITLTMEEDIMGEIVLTNEPNIFNKIGNLFKRKKSKSCSEDGIENW